MDPNAAYDAMVNLAREVMANEDEDTNLTLVELAEYVISLHEWVERGGFPPTVMRKREFAKITA